MAQGKFDEDVLRTYIFGKDNFVPKEAMELLARLLYDELSKYCEECEDDRMTCVLAPMCPERILLKVRLAAGAELSDLPQFCYQQCKNNVKRYLEKRTTLYTPVDNILFNEDFFEIFFPKISKKLIKAYKKKDIELINLIIEESDIPEVKLEFPLKDALIFRKIIQRDKLIKKGTFVYHISDSRRYMIIWFDNDIFIMDFLGGKTICNAKKDPIHDLNVVNIAFSVYCAEKELKGTTRIDPDDKENLTIEIRVPFNQIYPEKMNEDSGDFHKLLEFLQKYFFKIKIQHEEKPDNSFIISLQYSNSRMVQQRKGLLELNYDALHKLVENIDKLKKNDDE